MKKYFFITLLVLAQVPLVFAQIPDYHPELLPRPLQDVKINGEVSLSKEGYFIYNYSVYNPSQNNGRLGDIHIDIKKGEGTIALPSERLPVGVKCTRSITRMLTTGTVVPVGMDSPPIGFAVLE